MLKLRLTRRMLLRDVELKLVKRLKSKASARQKLSATTSGVQSL